MKNLLVRTISGIVFLLLMLAALLLGNCFECGKYFFALVMLSTLVVMMHEFYRMRLGSVYKVSRIIAIIGSCWMFLVTFLVQSFEQASGRFIILAFIPLFIVMINSLLVKDKSEYGKFSDIYTGILYIGVPWTLLNFTVFSNHHFDGMPLLCLFILIWFSDVGAYLFGCTLGQKYGPRLCPSISPKKSWIGFWGGFAAAVGVGIAMHYIPFLPFHSYPIWHCIVISVIVNVCGVCGDLIESQWKRLANLKDSGNIIPGHGGMLDRFDSALMAIPAATVYMMCFGLISF
ncbi:MAG: phosphatidate cytidylyltransferase [Candidatus Cryptobacteroides sp.]